MNEWVNEWMNFSATSIRSPFFFEFVISIITVSGLETEINGRGDPLRWPRDTLYPQKLALASLTSGSRSVGIVLLQTTSHGV
jgi:hypothetical protein